MKYIIGLDVGVTSVGWAVINEDKRRIEDLGVRLFPAAERPKDGGAINENRRLARGLRRRLKRKRVRMNKVKELFVKYGVLQKNELEKLYLLTNEDIDTWQLRAEGLDRKLSNREWARVLTAIAKRRGYKSNRKTDDADESKESGQLTKAIKLNKLYMQEKGYRTIGEMFAKDEKFVEHKRNKAGEYNNCVDRKELIEEAHILFETQRKLENNCASEEFEDEYIQVVLWQKEFMTKELMEKMIGKCRFEKDEPRASRNSYTFERFMLLQKVNNLSYQVGGEKIYLDESQRKELIDLAYNNKSGIKYSKIRTILNMPEDATFTGLSYYARAVKNSEGVYERPPYDEVKKKVENSTFVRLKGYHDINLALECIEGKEKILKDIDLLDEIAKALTLNKTDIQIIEDLSKLNLSEEIINSLLNINFTEFGHLSIKAMRKILPYLEEGNKYDEACRLAGYNFKADDGDPKYKLPVITKEDVRNPVVLRAVTQTRKVINAIIDKYGSPFEIHIEVARDLTKNFVDRKTIEKRQENNRSANEVLKTDIKDNYGINAKPVDMLKLKLYREQNCKSAYSGKPIDLDRLFENGYVEIDHAIPFSRSFDDSYNNKVLVLTRENQEKGNKTPYEYLTVQGTWESYEAWVKDTYRTNARKRENLLRKNFNADNEREWLERNLKDTQYMARFLSNYIKQNLLFEDFEEKENRVKVKTITGAATTAFRHYWGISAKNRELDLHHAEDAVIIACATDKYQAKIREYSVQKELYYPNKNGEYYDPTTGEIVDVKYKNHEMVRPWENFKEELEARMSKNPAWDIKHGDFTNYDDVNSEDIKPIFVSRMPNRKVSGQAHEETIYSQKHNNNENGIVVVKVPLTRITKEKMKCLMEKEECKKLYNSDKELYDRIYARLEAYDFKTDRAFPSDYVLRKKSKKGEGAIVKSVKLPTVMNGGVALEKNNAIAANGGMVRVDVFEKNNKFYLVPIYVADMIKNELPNKAIVAQKAEKDWLEMDETYNFKFSLYYNDMVRIKKGVKEIYGYFMTADRSANTVKIKFHDGSVEERPGVQNLEIFDKYVVDVLGNYHKVNKETRKGGIKKSK